MLDYVHIYPVYHFSLFRCMYLYLLYAFIFFINFYLYGVWGHPLSLELRKMAAKIEPKHVTRTRILTSNTQTKYIKIKINTLSSLFIY